MKRIETMEVWMILSSTHEVTQLLKAWTTGDEQALEKLTPLVYRQLHQAAQRLHGGATTRPYAANDCACQ